jgi:uncharacterized phiE125 gp8 family phage protein
MEYKVIIPPTTEPLTLAEVKTHLRLSSETFSGDVTASQSIAPGSHAIAAAYSLVGSSVDVLGKVAMVSLNAGAVGSGGSVAAKIQESDDNTIWQDFAAFTTVTADNDNSVQENDYTGGKQYIRVVATVAGAACEFSADVITKSGFPQEDSWLQERITEAREFCEDRTGRALATQTIEMYLDRFPCWHEIELKRPPLQSVTSVKYKDSAGTETTLTAGTQYIVDSDRDIGRIVLPYGVSWPSFVPYPVNAVKIRYTAGYTSENPIPKEIKAAMLVYIGYMYRNRDAVEPNDKTKERIIDMLIPHRTWWF